MTESDQYILKFELSKYYSKRENRHFIVKCGERSYTLEANPWTTLDLAWRSEKCWFMPGSVVTITDDQGNSKTFIKE